MKNLISFDSTFRSAIANATSLAQLEGSFSDHRRRRASLAGGRDDLDELHHVALWQHLDADDLTTPAFPARAARCPLTSKASHMEA